MTEYVITAIVIGLPLLVIFCAWAIWWCGRTARQNAAPQVSPPGDASALAVTPPRPADAAPYPDPWRCWIPHKEGADREEEINAYISAFIAGDQKKLIKDD